MEISLCMIVKNEEATLEKCLASISDAVDEIIVVDTGSTDSSKEIARKFTDKVYDFEWIDDFSAARNFAFSLATKELLMWLDADDVLSCGGNKKLIKLKRNFPKDVSIVYMPYNISFDKRGIPTFSYYRERLVRASAKPHWIEPVHEVIDIRGKAIYSDIAVEHRKVKQNPSGRNLKIMEKQIANGKDLSPRLLFYYARELMFGGEVEKAANVFEQFIDDIGGWSENKICACNDLSSCYEALGNSSKALETAIKGLQYDLPRSKTLCRIGELFLKSARYNEAEYWYKAAINSPRIRNLGFCEADYDGYIPALQLCVIYDKLGDKEKAIHYNEIAGSYKPDSPAYLYNKNYFQTTK
ncbi:MAG: glycosyltransferase family 2 protein [Clostridia bacterium]|nr:glycosyltransferase family 2 protein [Clostridia bacterium]